MVGQAAVRLAHERDGPDAATLAGLHREHRVGVGVAARERRADHAVGTEPGDELGRCLGGPALLLGTVEVPRCQHDAGEAEIAPVSGSQLPGHRRVLIHRGHVSHPRPVVRSVRQPALVQLSLLEHLRLEDAERLAVEEGVEQRTFRCDLQHHRDRRQRRGGRRKRSDRAQVDGRSVGRAHGERARELARQLPHRVVGIGHLDPRRGHAPEDDADARAPGGATGAGSGHVDEGVGKLVGIREPRSPPVAHGHHRDADESM